jgi:DNA repair photolyase
MADIEWDAKELLKGLDRLEDVVIKAATKGLDKIGDELLRLSEKEVPHDKGLLQASGSKERVSNEEVIVGYNKEYAAYQHEGHYPDGSHQIQQYQKGRKGKYLEDPLKMNLSIFQKFMDEALGRALQ